MLVFAFFSAVFSSVSWFIYALMFINSKLADERLLAQDLSAMLMFLAVVFLPILVVWMIFGYVNQFMINRDMNKKQSELLTQLQKNQDYTDLVVRVMLDAEHEIKDGFVLNKFDMFISDMNEALGEIIQRCNIASSAQLEQLWQRVRRGERWTLGKAILDASKNQSTFNAWVKEKINRDNVFRGSMLEFCSRYQNLLQLLEKHDRDRIFVRMIESGVFGKVYSIIAPMSDGLKNISTTTEVHSPQMAAAIQKTNEYTSALKLATMEEPKAEETIINVDRDDENDYEYEEEEEQVESRSFFSWLNPFRKKEEDAFETSEPDPFFQALHNSFHGETNLNNDAENNYPIFSDSPQNMLSEPRISEYQEEQKIPSFDQSRGTLDAIRSSSLSSDLTAVREELSVPTFSASVSELQAPKSDVRAEPILQSQPKVSTEDVEADDEDLVYPFGGWTDENNYNN